MEYTSKFAVETADEQKTPHNKTPWKRERECAYEDWVFKPDYAARRLRFPAGQTWLRILPPLQGSVHGWMLGVHAIEFEGGRFAHPRTLTRNAKCAFDHAYSWALQNCPQSLYSKTNKGGVRLLTNPLAAFWVAVEEEGSIVARLFLGSAYDGSRGGVPGLGWQIYQLSQQRDENGDLIANPAHPTEGVLLGVEKVQSKGAQYPSYRLQLGRQPVAADTMVEKMSGEEAGILVPLEETIRMLTPDEQWGRLAKVMDPATVERIRAGL